MSLVTNLTAASHMALALPEPSDPLTAEQHQAIKDAAMCRAAAKVLRDLMDERNQAGDHDRAKGCYWLSNELHGLANRLEEKAGIGLDEMDASAD